MAALTLEARRPGILVARIAQAGIHGDNVFVFGRDLGTGTAVVSLSGPAPALEDTMQRAEALDRQQVQDRTHDQQRFAGMGGMSR